MKAGFWKAISPWTEPTNIPVMQLPLQSRAPAQAPLLPDQRLYPSTGLVDIHHLLTVHRSADNTRSRNFTSSCPLWCPKAETSPLRLSWFHSLSLFWCATPKPGFPSLPRVCSEPQGTCRKCKSILEIALVSKAGEPWTLQVVLTQIST